MSQLYIEDRDFWHHVVCFNKESIYHTEFHITAQKNQDSKPDLPTFVLGKKLPHHLDPEFSEILVVDSVKSGKGRLENPGSDIFTSLISPILKVLRLNCQYIRTESENSVAQIASEISSSSTKSLTVLILSGDTSIHEFVNSLPVSNRSLCVCVVPLGTGNALALELGLDTPVKAVMSAFSDTATCRDFPIYKAEFPEGSYLARNEAQVPIKSAGFFVVFSWGLHAAIVGDSDTVELRKKGNERFKLAAQSNLTEILQSYKGSVSSFPQYSTHSYVLISLVKSLEPGFEISPESDIKSGKAYMVDIPFIESEAAEISGKNQFILDILYKVYDRVHLQDPRVNYKRVLGEGDVVELQILEKDARKRRVCVDGEIVTVGDGSVRILKDGNFKGWRLSLIGA